MKEEEQKERQRRTKRSKKEAKRALDQKIEGKRAWITNQQTHMIEKIVERVKETCGFLPDSSLFVKLNARKILGNTTKECYFNKVSNRPFRDLTLGKSIPPAAYEILDLGLKFVPTPKHTASYVKAIKSPSRLAYQLGLETICAGLEDQELPKNKAVHKVNIPPVLIIKGGGQETTCVSHGNQETF